MSKLNTKQVEEKAIRYSLHLATESGGRKLDAMGKDGYSYVPTVRDAEEWYAAQDKFILVLDRLGLILTIDGDTRCDRIVGEVEAAYELLLVD